MSNVIREAKRRHNNIQIENSKNKMKTIWDISRTLTGVKVKKEDIDQLNINVDIYYNFQTIPDFPDNYILPKTKKKKPQCYQQNNNSSADYVYQNFNKTFLNIKYQYTSTKEV